MPAVCPAFHCSWESRLAPLMLPCSSARTAPPLCLLCALLFTPPKVAALLLSCCLAPLHARLLCACCVLDFPLLPKTQPCSSHAAMLFLNMHGSSPYFASLPRVPLCCLQTLGSEYEIDFINLSYTRNAEDVREARRCVRSRLCEPGLSDACMPQKSFHACAQHAEDV
eukprot:1160244-Pelagomonas_calceolata.AAC.5